jgi:diguanylate cyclase (GGDEF)-like protein
MKYHLHMLKRLLGDILTNLGPLEGDYRAANLKSDIRQGILYILIVTLGFLIQPWGSAPSAAIGYFIFSAVFAALLYKTTKVRVYDRLMAAWLILSLLLHLVLRHISSNNLPPVFLDLPLLFVTYLAAPLPFHQTVFLALVFSLGMLYSDHLLVPVASPLPLRGEISAHFITHLLGALACLQIQTHRRASFQAFLDEKDATKMVAYLTNIDPLTKSLTRRQFINIAESEFRRFQRYQRPLSLMILDTDRLKNINDTYGHHAGDLVLRSLSLIAMEQKRAQDTFGRLGGEEFGLLMPETTLDNARIVAERIRLIWETSPVKLDGEPLRSTVSIGLAQAESTDRSLEDLLRRAEQMLLKAKNSGRNRVES